LLAQANFTLGGPCQVDHAMCCLVVNFPQTRDANYSNKYNTLLHYSRLTVL